MPVYYSGELCDLDDSDWEDPRDLAYAEYVDQYKFDAPEGFELKVFDRSKAVDVPVMMVGERWSGHVRQKLSSCSLPEADMVCTEPVADILTVGHDVPGVAESPIHQNSCETDGGRVAFCYEGDLNYSDCGSVGDHELDTWEDWCDSDFLNGYSGFPPDIDDPQPPVVFSGQVFWGEDIAKPSLYDPVTSPPMLSLQEDADCRPPISPPRWISTILWMVTCCWGIRRTYPCSRCR